MGRGNCSRETEEIVYCKSIINLYYVKNSTTKATSIMRRANIRFVIFMTSDCVSGHFAKTSGSPF